MRRLVYSVLTLMAALPLLTSCLKDNSDPFEDWRDDNNAWLDEQLVRKNANGSQYYEKVMVNWNPTAYVLMHWHNDRSKTVNNLKPISTSTVDVKYRLRDYQGLGKDSSYLRTIPADSIYRSRVNSNIEGWVIGVTNMHVGDSVTMIVPYQYGYGAQARGAINPYTHLVFDMKLTGVPGYIVPVN